MDAISALMALAAAFNLAYFRDPPRAWASLELSVIVLGLSAGLAAAEHFDYELAKVILAIPAALLLFFLAIEDLIFRTTLGSNLWGEQSSLWLLILCVAYIGIGIAVLVAAFSDFSFSRRSDVDAEIRRIRRNRESSKT